MPASPRRLGSSADLTAYPGISGRSPSRTQLWLGLAVLLLAAAVAAPSSKGYAALRHYRWLRAAQAAFDRGDYPAATWTARRVLERDPTNLRATRLLAETAGHLNSRDAIHWRARIVELEPDESSNLLAWAQTALEFEDLSTATIALNRVPEAARTSPAFADVAATLALGQHDPALAARQLATGVALDPANRTRQLRMAIIQLQTDSEVVRSDGRATLDRLRANPTLRAQALSALAREAMSNDRYAEALDASHELLAWNPAAWPPRLLRAEILRTCRSNEFLPYLTQLKADAAAAPSGTNTALLLSWMATQELGTEALTWVKTLRPDRTLNPPVAISVADLLAYLNDWVGLRAWTKTSHWGADEPIRLAYEAHAVHQLPAELRRPNETETLWHSALKLADRDPARLERLAVLAGAWNLTSLLEASWWAVADAAADPEPALLHLTTFYRSRSDTVGRFRVARRLLEFRPEDRFAQNETAYLGLLLGIDDPDPHSLAERLRHRPPMRPEAVITYAFSLWRRNRVREAVGAFDALPISTREEPGWAWFYGAVLAEAGDFGKARRYLALGADGRRTSEEEALYRAARQRVGAR